MSTEDESPLEVVSSFCWDQTCRRLQYRLSKQAGREEPEKGYGGSRAPRIAEGEEWVVPPVEGSGEQENMLAMGLPLSFGKLDLGQEKGEGKKGKGSKSRRRRKTRRGGDEEDEVEMGCDWATEGAWGESREAAGARETVVDLPMGGAGAGVEVEVGVGGGGGGVGVGVGVGVGGLVEIEEPERRAFIGGEARLTGQDADAVGSGTAEGHGEGGAVRCAMAAQDPEGQVRMHRVTSGVPGLLHEQLRASRCDGGASDVPFASSAPHPSSPPSALPPSPPSSPSTPSAFETPFCPSLAFSSSASALSFSSSSCPSLKYWAQRFSLFSRFDHGVALDAESWFSVTPQAIAEHQAGRCAASIAASRRGERRSGGDGDSRIAVPLAAVASSPAAGGNPPTAASPAASDVSPAASTSFSPDVSAATAAAPSAPPALDLGLAVDAFCGAGGNAIQLAAAGFHVLAVDIDPEKIRLARHNATIYGVEHRIEFLNADFIDVCRNCSKVKADVLFLSPPWGGPAYLDAPHFDIRTMLQPCDGFLLLEMASRLSPNIAFFLPRNTDMAHLHELSLCLKARGLACQVEKNYLNGKFKTLTVYCGLIAISSSAQMNK